MNTRLRKVMEEINNMFMSGTITKAAWLGIAATVCAGNWVFALPTFDMSQETQQAKEVVERTQSKLDNRFVFRIKQVGAFSPGAAAPGTVAVGSIQLEASFPNGLFLTNDPTSGIIRTFFSKEELESWRKNPGTATPAKKGKKESVESLRPGEFRGIMFWANGALNLSLPGICQTIWPDGRMTLATSCSTRKYLDPAYEKTEAQYGQMFKTADVNLVGDHPPSQFWLIDIDSQESAEGTLFWIDWQGYIRSAYGANQLIVCYKQSQQEVDEIIAKRRGGEKLTQVDCAIHHKSTGVMSTPAGYVLEDGRTIIPIIPRRWITDEHPTP